MIHVVRCSVGLLCLGCLSGLPGRVPWSVPCRPRMVSHGTRPGDDLYTTPRLDSSDLSSSCTQKHHPTDRVARARSHTGWHRVPGPHCRGGAMNSRNALRVTDLSLIAEQLSRRSRRRRGDLDSWFASRPHGRLTRPPRPAPMSRGQGLRLAAARRRARSSAVAGMVTGPRFRLRGVRDEDSIQHGT